MTLTLRVVFLFLRDASEDLPRIRILLLLRRAQREDDFGKVVTIETSGGGVEPGEDLRSAVRRELKEELGAETNVIKIMA